MLEAKEPMSNRMDDPWKFLNVIAYSEMVRRMTDKKIVLYYSTQYTHFYEFRKKHGHQDEKRRTC